MRRVTRLTISTEILEIINNSGPLRMMERYNIPSLTGGSLYLRWDWGWAISAKIDVLFFPIISEELYKATVEVSWPSSSYSPSHARTAVNLHSQVADLACRIECLLDEVIVITGEEE